MAFRDAQPLAELLHAVEARVVLADVLDGGGDEGRQGGRSAVGPRQLAQQCKGELADGAAVRGAEKLCSGLCGQPPHQFGGGRAGLAAGQKGQLGQPGEELRRRLPGELDAEQMAAALRGKGQRGAAQDQMAGRHALGRQDESRPRRGRPGSGQGGRAFSAGDQAHPQPFARQREEAFGLDILHRGQRGGGAPIKNQYLTPQINKMLFYITK